MGDPASEAPLQPRLRDRQQRSQGEIPEAGDHQERDHLVVLRVNALKVGQQVLPGDDAKSLATRVLIAEHQLYPRVMADFVTRDCRPETLLDRIRALALALPEAAEKLSHGSPGFFVTGGKFFAYFSANHHGDGRIALLVKISGIDEQHMLIESDAERYFRPAYFGDGWVGIRLDCGPNDWSHIDEWLLRSWRSAAPNRLAAMPF